VVWRRGRVTPGQPREDSLPLDQPQTNAWHRMQVARAAAGLLHLSVAVCTWPCQLCYNVGRPLSIEEIGSCKRWGCRSGSRQGWG
jgi:hypothetical protein